MARSAVLFFCAALMVSLAAQGLLWWSVDFVDESFWVRKVEFLKEDIFKTPFVFDAERHAAHPGTLVLWPAAGLTKIGLAATDSLRLSVTLINAVIITAIVITARQLRSESPWWLGVAGVMLFNPIYQNVNPLDVVVAALVVLLFLILWRCLENRRALVVLAILLGLMAATRLHITALIAGPVLVALAYKKGLKQTALVGLGALITALALMPFLWLSPVVFLRAAGVNQLMYFTDQTIYLSETSRLSLGELIKTFPLVIFSFLLAMVGLVWKRYAPLLRFFVVTLLAETVLVLSVFGLSNVQSDRYIFPVMVVWEVMLPLFILHLMSFVRWPRFVSLQTARWAVILLLSGTYLALLTYSLLLPEPVYI